MLCCKATCLTAEGVSFIPRPLGRSGWVNTKGTLKPAAIMAAKACAANSGVPAKNNLHDDMLSRCCFLILLLRRLSFKLDRYCTNTLPLRWSISCCTHTASNSSQSISKNLPVASCARKRTRSVGRPLHTLQAQTNSLLPSLFSALCAMISGLIKTIGVSRSSEVSITTMRW